MLSLFSKRKLAVDLGRYIRRICDQTMPNRPVAAGESRRNERLYRTIPTLICPWEDSAPRTENTVFALTSNLSNRGVGLLLTQPLSEPQVLLGYWIDPDDAGQPWYFVGRVTHQEPAGGGFWRAGVELVEYANEQHPETLEVLQPLAAQLLPQKPAAAAV